VKVVGEGHSPSDIHCTTDYMISLKKLNKVLDVSIIAIIVIMIIIIIIDHHHCYHHHHHHH
jgi:cell division protein FtsL